MFTCYIYPGFYFNYMFYLNVYNKGLTVKFHKYHYGGVIADLLVNKTCQFTKAASVLRLYILYVCVLSLNPYNIVFKSLKM